ncbi:unnamed protein product [Brassica oleracea]|uniref:(rape) hypothetical protein n=1 Tax=Brassica napus TaxID=3708 RepID=A0A816IQV2_BRANA|nr:unnamed protein product [Brassica napus]
MALEHKYLMEQCLEHHNAEAHYIEGEKDFRHPKMRTNVNYIQQLLEKDQKSIQ